MNIYSYVYTHICGSRILRGRNCSTGNAIVHNAKYGRQRIIELPSGAYSGL